MGAVVVSSVVMKEPSTGGRSSVPAVPAQWCRGHETPAGDALHVVVAFPIGDEALALLGDRTGGRVVVRDIRQPGPPPQLVLCPPSSPQLIGLVRRQFPRAAVVVVELEEWLRTIHVQGPITRALDAGAATYYVAPTTVALAGFLTELAAGQALLPIERAPAARNQAIRGFPALGGPLRALPASETDPMLPDPVQQVVTRYLDAADAARPGLVEALYLVGSVVLDDFQASTSDVDFVAVTTQPSDAETVDALEAAHAEVRAAAGLPAFEGCYVTFDELRVSPSLAAPGLFHHDGKLQTGPNMRTPIEWTTLARHGLALRGPAPATIGVHTDSAELAAWTVSNLDDYWTPWVQRSRDPDTQTAMALLTDWGVAWGVLGVSRLHYTLATGQITSKTGAGHHALNAFDSRWHPILTEALRCRPMPLALPESLEEAKTRRDEAAAFMEAAIAAARALDS